MTTVLMTTDTVGGVWDFCLELAGALECKDVHFALASMGRQPTAPQQRAAARLANVSLFSSSYKLEWMQDPWEDVAEAGEWLRDVAAQVRPELIHINGYAHAALNWPQPVVVTAHSCVLSWWRAVKKAHAPHVWRRYRINVCRGLTAADIVTAPTAAMLAALQFEYGALAHTRVIYNGRANNRFRAGDKKAFVFAAGRVWDDAKNIQALAEVAPALNWPVVVAGDNNHPDGHVADFSNVRFIGRVDSDGMVALLSRAAIYALPVRYEPFGLSILEAALSGCALVLGDIASQRELWQQCALFVAPDDPHALRDAIERLSNDHQLRRRLAVSAMRRARLFTAERLGAGYFNLYRSLCNRQSQYDEHHRTNKPSVATERLFQAIG